jgi:endogenous inhibitor of DNA gyrase (YacG/DUF329 family)
MGVTPTRLFSGKLSGSRNETPSPYAGRSIDAATCHWCRDKFCHGQMRYPILDGTTAGWNLVSVCMECFKDSSDEYNPSPQPRQENSCPGCGEPVFVSPNLRLSLKFCSIRCRQRDYRKRRRETGSAISWKNYESPKKCASCKKPLGSKRKDTKFCSNKCRQWQYRRRLV